MVPSAMLVMANTMATISNTIAMIIQVTFVAYLLASCSEVGEVDVCAAEPFTILRELVINFMKLMTPSKR